MMKQLFLISLIFPLAMNASSAAGANANANASAAAVVSSAADDKARADEKDGAASSAAADQKESKAQLDATSAQSIVDWLEVHGKDKMAAFQCYGQAGAVGGNLWHAMTLANLQVVNVEADAKFIEALMLAEQQRDRLTAVPLIAHVIASRTIGEMQANKSTDVIHPHLQKLSIDMLQYLTHRYSIYHSHYGSGFGETYACPNCRLVWGDHDTNLTLDCGSFPTHIHNALRSACPNLQDGLTNGPLHIKAIWPILLGYTGAFGVHGGNVVVDEQLPGISIRDIDSYATMQPPMDFMTRIRVRWLTLPHRRISSYDGLANVLQGVRMYCKGISIDRLDLHGNRLTKIASDFRTMLGDSERHRHYTIDLSNNHISEIEKGLCGIRQLILRENRLVRLPDVLMEEELLKDLEYLDLRGNPLVDNPEEMQKVEMLRNRGIKVDTAPILSPAEKRDRQKQAQANTPV